MSFERCNAKTRQGRTCAKPAGWGTPNRHGRCRLHGGATPDGQLFARRLAASQAVETLGLPRAVHPMEALAQELARTEGRVAAILALLDGLTSEELPVGYLDGLSRPQLLELLSDERRHLVRVSEAAVRCGVAEHLVRVEEHEGRMVAEGMLALIGALGLSLQDPQVQAAVHRVLGPAPEHGVIEGPSVEPRR